MARVGSCHVAAIELTIAQPLPVTAPENAPGVSALPVAALLLLWMPSLALAQPAPPPPTPAPAGGSPELPAEDNGQEEAIVVTGPKRGSVMGTVKPEVTLDPGDVRSYGASTVGELLDELAPLTGSDSGGEPIVLLSGRRISNLREIRDLPPEAIDRVDILPEEVALKYGYPADQKVVNFVLSRRFDAVTGELETLQSLAGGRQGLEADLSYLSIGKGSRLSIDAEYERLNPLFEAERDLVEPEPDRTLLSGSDAAKLGGTYNRTILGNVSATVSTELRLQDTRAALGRASDDSRRLRDGRRRTGVLNYALNGFRGGWQWSLTGGYERDQFTNRTDRDYAGGMGRDRATTLTQTLESDATASGDLLDLPAGAVAVTVRAGFTARGIASRSDRNGVLTPTDLSRRQANGRSSLDIPLLRDSALGSLSANLNGEVEELSDLGTLTTLGYGLHWQPVEAVRLVGSVSREDNAPTIQQLGNPAVVTPNVRVLDLATGQSVEVTAIEGGNPELLADNRRTMRLGLTVKPTQGLTLLAKLSDMRTANPIASFPTATPQIEAAFPDRFERDAGGTLLRVDSRPVNFARSHRRQLRWGFNWAKTLKSPPAAAADSGRSLSQEPLAERPKARSDLPARMASLAGQGSGREGRLRVSLFHTWRLQDTVVLRSGLPKLDLLDGAATNGRGGEPSHELEFSAGYTARGLGASLRLDWQSATTARANVSNGAMAATDLTFGALARMNVRLFADLGQQQPLVRSAPFFSGSRFTLKIDNIFDERIDVRDSAGIVPPGYQPDLMDPLGRSVRLSFRKLFS